MRRLNQLIDRFCYSHPRFGIPNLMLYIIIGNVSVYLLDMVSRNGYAVSSLLTFNRTLILQGEVWRLLTFIFVPSSFSPLFFLLAMYFLWFIGSHLEREWGSAKFTCYYLLGWLLAVVTGLFTGYASTGYIELTMFLAFATLYPDMQFLIMFIIPIKAKWLAWLDGALLAFSFILNLFSGSLSGAVLIVAAVLNYLIFFWPELMYHVGRMRGQAKYSRQPNVVNFKKAAREMKQREYTHKCDVCGRTDVSDPSLDFRYCSRCAGYHCYCMDHISNHVHITEE